MCSIMPAMRTSSPYRRERPRRFRWHLPGTGRSVPAVPAKSSRLLACTGAPCLRHKQSPWRGRPTHSWAAPTPGSRSAARLHMPSSTLVAVPVRRGRELPDLPVDLPEKLAVLCQVDILRISPDNRCTPSFLSGTARFQGRLAPPNCTITPSGFSVSQMLSTCSER